MTSTERGISEPAAGTRVAAEDGETLMDAGAAATKTSERTTGEDAGASVATAKRESGRAIQKDAANAVDLVMVIIRGVKLPAREAGHDLQVKTRWFPQKFIRRRKNMAGAQKQRRARAEAKHRGSGMACCKRERPKGQDRIHSRAGDFALRKSGAFGLLVGKSRRGDICEVCVWNGLGLGCPWLGLCLRPDA